MTSTRGAHATAALAAIEAEAPTATPAVQKRSHLQQLADAGFTHFLRPAAPPDVPITLKDGERLSDGKIPSQYRNGKWFGQRWRETTPTDASIAQWANSPGVNCCLVTGEVIAFDIDIKVARADPSEQARRWKALADRIVLEIAKWLETDVSELAVRRRDDNSSCAVFLRWQGPQLHKRAWRIVDRDSGANSSWSCSPPGSTSLSTAGINPAAPSRAIWPRSVWPGCRPRMGRMT